MLERRGAMNERAPDPRCCRSRHMRWISASPSSASSASLIGARSTGGVRGARCDSLIAHLQLNVAGDPLVRARDAALGGGQRAVAVAGDLLERAALHETQAPG